MGWPYVVKRCLSCGEGPPKKRYRARGLCTSCHPVHQANGTLRRFREIPDDLQDGKVRALKADPRRYLISVLGKTYADRFDDDTVGEEALRVFRVTRDRWYRKVAYVEDPRPKPEDFVFSQGDATEYSNRDELEVEVPEEVTPAVAFRREWDGKASVVQRGFPVLGPGRVREEADAWVVAWGDAFRFLELRVPKTGRLGEATLVYQYDLREFHTAPYTHSMLLKLAYALATPPVDDFTEEDLL